MKLDNIKNDSYIAICLMVDKIVTLKQVTNLIDDIISITRNVTNSTFAYYNKSPNSPIDRIAKKTPILFLVTECNISQLKIVMLLFSSKKRKKEKK